MGMRSPAAAVGMGTAGDGSEDGRMLVPLHWGGRGGDGSRESLGWVLGGWRGREAAGLGGSSTGTEPGALGGAQIHLCAFQEQQLPGTLRGGQGRAASATVAVTNNDRK